MICKNCGKVFDEIRKPKDFCSSRCYDNYKKWNNVPNCKCPICGIKFWTRPSRIAKTEHPICCSKECEAKQRSKWFSGEGNHQFGLKGELNSSFKGAEICRNNNTVVDILVYDPTHPYSDPNGRVLKHRLVVEQNYKLFDSKFFLNEGGRIVLKKEYQVHHKDKNHNNNDVSNLEVLTRSEHTTEHNKEKEIIRDPKNGRIIGVVKRGELLESCDANQQPSQPLTKLEGSETNS
jgi:hypothetical protein